MMENINKNEMPYSRNILVDADPQIHLFPTYYITPSTVGLHSLVFTSATTLILQS